MTNAEISQCILDIRNWFSRNAKNLNIPSGASSSSIQRLTKAIDTPLPNLLLNLLKEVDGGIFFMDKKLLNCEEIIDETLKLSKNKNFKSNYIPFGKNVEDDTYLIIEMNLNNIDSNDGNICEYEEDEGITLELSSSILTYFEKYRDDLLSGKVEYLDQECGVIEKYVSSNRK